VGAGIGFESDENAVTVLWKERQQEFSMMPKTKLARELIKLMSGVLSSKNPID
jgi:hypothetical protein